MGIVVVAVMVESKAYSSVAPVSPCTLCGSVVRALRGGEGLPKLFCLVVSSLGLLRLSSAPL